MARVVYFLGAGFSQPLGVPTIGEFLDKARDQQTGNQERFGYFQPLLHRVEGLYKAGTFFESEMTNIEEILSLLEADAFVNEPSLKQEFIKFICDVIKFHTPPIVPMAPGKMPGNWEGFVFGDRQRTRWNEYGYFTVALLNLQLGLDSSTRKLIVSDELGPTNTYSVVTTNYDLVLESVCDYAQKNSLSGGEKVAFRRASGKQESGSGKVSLAKLHGSVDDCEIMPPTWSKGATPEYAAPWNLALKVLSEAQEVRIIGYSLPEGDSYVRYLLKAAAIRNPDLRKVHVLCRDPDNRGRMEERYERFVKRGFLFRNMDSWQYLYNLLERITSQQTGSLTHLLESTHANFFGPR